MTDPPKNQEEIRIPNGKKLKLWLTIIGSSIVLIMFGLSVYRTWVTEAMARELADERLDVVEACTEDLDNRLNKQEKNYGVIMNELSHINKTLVKIEQKIP